MFYGRDFIAVTAGEGVDWRDLKPQILSILLDHFGLIGFTPRPISLARIVGVVLLLAGVAGLVLAAVTTWWLLLVGAAAIAAGWFYTGGSRPYGYRALGEVSVFVFFGLVSVVGLL